MRFFLWWGKFVVQRPVLVVAVSLALMAIFSAVNIFIPKDLSFTGMLDEHDPELIRYRSAVRTFGGTAAMVILLEGEPEALHRAAARLVKELPERAPVKKIVPPADPQWILDRAPWLWPEPIFRSVLTDVESGSAPVGSNASPSPALSSVEKADNIVRKRIRPTPNAVLLSLSFTSDIFDMAMGGKDYIAVTREVEKILKETGGGVTADYTGIAAIGAQDQNSVFTRLKIISPITLVLVLLLLYGVERRTSRIVVAGIALAGSVGATFGLVGLIMGKLSITATFFGMLLLGLGIDFAIHLLVAMRDAHSHGHTPEHSVMRGLELSGVPITLGALTTALATGVLIFVPQPGATDMGLTATLGLLVSLVFMLSFLPAAWLILERRSGHAEPPARMVLPGLHTVVRFSIRHHRFVLVFTLVVTLAAMTGLRKYDLESDLKQIMSRDVPALKVDKRIQELFGIAPVSYLVPVPSLEEAHRVAADMLREDDIVDVYTPSDWILPDADKRGERMRQALAAVPASDTSPLVGRLRRALKLGPVELDQIPLAFRAGTVGEGDALAVQVVPKVSLLDAKAIEEQIGRLRKISPEVTGIPVVALKLMTGTRDWIPLILAIIATVVLGVLVISFRNARDVFLSFLPVCVAAGISMGAFFLLGLSFSILTGIVVPVILGLGVDDGIHIVERLRHIGRRDDEAITEAVEGVGRAIFLTSATTTISFVGLFYCKHYGLESMAEFMSMGVPLCFVASVTVLPAAIVFLRGPAPKP